MKREKKEKKKSGGLFSLDPPTHPTGTARRKGRLGPNPLASLP